MTSLQSIQITPIEIETLKLTTTTLFSLFQSHESSDLKPVSNQNSDIKIDIINQLQDQQLNDMNVYELLDKCDNFINKHTLLQQKQKFKSINTSVNYLNKNINISNKNQSSVNTKYHTSKNQLTQQCSQCKYHLLKELQWSKQKIILQNKIKQLEISLNELLKITQLQKGRQLLLKKQQSQQSQIQKYKIKQSYNLQINSQVYLIEIKDYEEVYGLMSQSSPTPQTTSIIRSEHFSQLEHLQQGDHVSSVDNVSSFHKNISVKQQLQIVSQKQVLLQSIKSFNEKLTQTQIQNKYLRIQNRTLMKTKSQIQSMRKQIQKTRSQRDMFKKKLILLNEKSNINSNSNINNNINSNRNNNQITNRNKNKNIFTSHQNQKNIVVSGLKQRGLQGKKKNQTLFELSLTDASSIKQTDDQSWRHNKKQQRINLTTINNNNNNINNHNK